ncbi:MAG: hypothetical protein CMK07_09005 [Ponticaulis sp.]|nr:hypothetical protein [Ponticaulis sp.]
MRKPLTIVILLAYVVGYIALAATIGSWLAESPVWMQIGYFAVAGIIWVFPLKPLFKWGNKGS